MAGDLTKRYNRLRQHVSASTSGHAAPQNTAHSVSSGEKSLSSSSGVLPALNRPKPSQNNSKEVQNGEKSKNGVHATKVDSSLAALSHRYAAQLNLGSLASAAESTGGHAAARKGGSEKVAHKDKSDRATTEQVLDPRTRLVLYKMLGRGLLSKIEGCISTGKEVCVSLSKNHRFEIDD